SASETRKPVVVRLLGVRARVRRTGVRVDITGYYTTWSYSDRLLGSLSTSSLARSQPLGLQPAQAVLGKFPPSAVDRQRMITAGELRYALSALLTSTGGTVLSSAPEISSNGPRVAFATLTFVAEFGLKVAVAAWNSGRPGAGIAYFA